MRRSSNWRRSETEEEAVGGEARGAAQGASWEVMGGIGRYDGRRMERKGTFVGTEEGPNRRRERIGGGVSGEG